jgi:hypothetical protein
VPLLGELQRALSLREWVGLIPATWDASPLMLPDVVFENGSDIPNEKRHILTSSDSSVQRFLQPPHFNAKFGLKVCVAVIVQY